MLLKQTDLFAMHQKYGGKMVDFGGWDLPIQYEGILKEHHMVRKKAGLFDVSHMGEIEIKGEKAEEYVQYLLSNNIKKMAQYQVQYNIMCYPDGGVVDDLIVYKYSPEHYFLVVNAANTDKDYEWIMENAFPGLEIKNLSDDYVQMAVQGPKAQEILQKLTEDDLDSIKFFWFKPELNLSGVNCIASRTGYTGEDGFEIYLSPEKAAFLWEEILQAGGEDICPIGLGARDTLRFEAKLPLYGQEIGKDISPLEAKLGFFVKLDNDDFIGKEALLAQKEGSMSRIQVEFEMLGKGIPRSHYDVEKNGNNIGWVTSGAYAPSLDKKIGLALINRQYSQAGEEIDVVIRNKRIKARVAEGIFYKKKTGSK
jgi:aminomethyltransferase